jgi:two-component system, OmpR family, sensor histidine kinase SenX3
MQITSRSKTIAFFIVLGCLLVAIAIALNVTWILKWESIASLVTGIVLFALVIAGLIVNTIFLVREIRRNEQHDSFINAVTHELKTPIASIRLYLETLQSREVSEQQRQDFYRIMHKDTDRLTTTVEQVLRAAETVQKRRVRDWAPVNMTALLHECIDMARQRHQLSAAQLCAVQSSVADAQTLIMGDVEELRTAIANLLDNAVKYSPDLIRISSEISAHDDAVVIRISDQGVGIPQQDLKQVFKRFYRTGAARNKVKGTGLGLFIVRSILKKHRGNVIADSDGEGQGTTMTLRLPGWKPQ